MKEIRKGILHGTGIFLVILIGTSVTMLLAQSLNVFSSGDVVSAAMINSNFSAIQARFTKTAPVGAILAWHKDFAGTPSLPAGWAECDGTVINDSESPYDGQTLPNLNAPLNSWNAKGAFLRGHTSSGQLEDDRLQSHKHDDAGHSHSLGTISFPGPNPPRRVLSPDLNWDGTGWVGTGYASLGDPTDSGSGAGTPRHAAETRPASMSVIWIMRIK